MRKSRKTPLAHGQRARPQLELLEDRLAPASLPTGFAESVVAQNIQNATAMEIAPDGRIWVLEQGGDVEVFRPGSTNGWTALNLPSSAISDFNERGLLGIAFHPNYDINSVDPDYVYLYYTSTANPNPHNRISRFTVDNTNPDQPTLGNEIVIVDLDPLSSAGNHNGGAIHFGPDGKLYVAVGENATPAHSQSLSNRHGKILRLNADGSIPSDNPTSFAGLSGSPTGVNRAIWAVGLRNPFTFTFQPGTGKMFINDVGSKFWEEINVGKAGANYGWPTTEGNFSASQHPHFRKPFYTYAHGGGTFQGFAITGGAFYNPANPGLNRFPNSYVGDYFFADFVNNWINVIDTTTKEVRRFASAASSTVDLRVTDDGSLYYLARGEGRVYRVVYTGNESPSIGLHPQDKTLSEGNDVGFSVNANGTAPLSYQWQRSAPGSTAWNDISGAVAATLNLQNVQTSENGARFRVIVTNDFGSETSEAATLTVTANQAPGGSIAIDSGLTNNKFVAGQTIVFSGNASDPEDGPLGGGSFTWRVDFISSIDSGNPVERPFLPAFSGQAGGSFTPATVGPYLLTDVLYRVVLTITDGDGASSTVTRDIAPNTATLTLTTNPAGLQLVLDGQPVATPHLFESVVGFERTLSAPGTQSLAGASYAFTGWSDGTAAAHTLVTPASDTSYTANYEIVPGFDAKINFQSTGSPGFPDYAPDTGAAYGNRGNGLTYGWNASNTPGTDRNAANSPDERYDTFLQMQRSSNRNASWEIAVPNGTYAVHVVAGDPSAFNSTYKINVEGVRAINGKPSSANRWLENTVIVTVRDGRLTLANATGAKRNKIAFTEITPAAPFQQASGLVSIEAESFDGNVNQGGKRWRDYTSTSGFSGLLALQAWANKGVTNDTDYVSLSPRLDYRINFTQTGVHYVWVRGLGPAKSDDSIHIGLDGAGASADRISGFGKSYGWINATLDGPVATIDVTSAGIHTLSLWMREDGVIVDKIIITTDPNFIPTGQGPGSSSRLP